MENPNTSKALKTPSPPAKMKLFLESLDNYDDRKISTSGGSRTSSYNSITNNNNENQFNNQHSLQKLNQHNNQINQQQQNNQLTSDLETGLKTEDYNFKTAIKPLSSESQLASLTCRSRLGNTTTGDALTGIVKKYRELQAKSKVSLVLDDSTDEDSDTPSFKCNTDDEEEEKFSLSQNTNSLESSNKLTNNKKVRQYKSEPQLSSFENSVNSFIFKIMNKF